MAVAAAMPNDAPLLWPPTNLAPETHAPATARRAMTAMTALAVLRALAAWMMTPIAVTRSSCAQYCVEGQRDRPVGYRAAECGEKPSPVI